MIITPYSSFTRPNDSTDYSNGDLVANDTSAAAVVPLKFGVAKLGYGTGRIRGARLHKNDVTATNANFDLHLFLSDPAVTVGDNAQLNNSGAFAVGSMENWIGTIAMDMTTGAVGLSTSLTKNFPLTNPLFFDLELATNAGRVLYGLMEAKAAYDPNALEVFKVTLYIENEA